MLGGVPGSNSLANLLVAHGQGMGAEVSGLEALCISLRWGRGGHCWDLRTLCFPPPVDHPCQVKLEHKVCRTQGRAQA